MNQSLSPDQPGFPAYSGSGGTSIYGPRGVELAMAKSVHEEFVRTSIPIASFRARYRLPDIPMALVKPVYDKYVPPHPPGILLDELPPDSTSAAKYVWSRKTW